uniref:Uncharacterized protein n=1 Tax=Picea glauca TaxID=3330 RepID=A0A101LVM7_PICGL|nr:hypothetical protein ABT39_MTgene2010 [Picea glauca]QHR87369.1 hypothetical protein Q903MT_gene1379 [Picea sitchensis]
MRGRRGVCSGSIFCVEVWWAVIQEGGLYMLRAAPTSTLRRAFLLYCEVIPLTNHFLPFTRLASHP